MQLETRAFVLHSSTEPSQNQGLDEIRILTPSPEIMVAQVSSFTFQSAVTGYFR